VRVRPPKLTRLDVRRAVQAWCDANGIRCHEERVHYDRPSKMMTLEIEAGARLVNYSGKEQDVFEAMIKAFQVEEQSI
jgi:hypothetical protein